MVSKEIKKKILIAIISILFFYLITGSVAATGGGYSIGNTVFLFILIALGTFLLNRYATSYNIYYLFAVLFLGFTVVVFVTTFPVSIQMPWQVELLIFISFPTLYITITRPKHGWAIGTIVSLSIILAYITDDPSIPLEAINRTLIVYITMIATGAVCGLLGEYIGKKLRKRVKDKGATDAKI